MSLPRPSVRAKAGRSVRAEAGRGVDLLGFLTRIVPERSCPAIHPSRVRTVLIIKLSSIGDVVHALPVASALKQANPSIRISWAVEEWTAPLVEGHPAVDRIIRFPAMNAWPARPSAWVGRMRASVTALNSEAYDVAIDLQGLARSAILSRLSRSTYRVARAGQREGAHLVSRAVPLPAGHPHAVEEYLAVAAALGARVEPVSFGLQASAAARRSVARLIAPHPALRLAPPIVVNPSASKRWKEWPPDRWVRAIDELAAFAPVVLIGSRNRMEAHAAIAGKARVRPVDFTGHTTLAEVIAVLERALLHVAPDTGTVHIAAALGVPVVAIYGPTDPRRVGPYAQPDGVVHRGTDDGGLAAITPEDVLARARAVLAERCGRMPAS